MNKHVLFFEDTFKKEFAKLSAEDQKKVWVKIKLLAENPFFPSIRSKKVKGHPGLFEMSVNMAIRIIWKYKDNQIIVLIDVGHHDILKRY